MPTMRTIMVHIARNGSCRAVRGLDRLGAGRLLYVDVPEAGDGATVERRAEERARWLLDNGLADDAIGGDA